MIRISIVLVRAPFPKPYLPPSRKMKIVINTIPLLSPLAGVGHYIYNLLIEFQRLRPDIQYTFYYGYFSKKLKAYGKEELVNGIRCVK